MITIVPITDKIAKMWDQFNLERSLTILRGANTRKHGITVSVINKVFTEPPSAKIPMCKMREYFTYLR